MQRRIVERSTELTACHPRLQTSEEVELALEVASDGTTRAKLLATSLTECSIISCVREKLTGMQVAAPKAGQPSQFRWLMVMAPGAPVSFSAPGAPAEPSAKAPASRAACLDTPSAPPWGHLAPEVIHNAVRARFERIRSCYVAGLGRHADLKGKVSVRFVIGKDGKVSEALISDNELPDCVVARCIRDAMKPIQFPRPKGGTVTVQYPIMLQPG